MTRPKDIATTATSAATDDYLLIDGATNGSRKILASNLSSQGDVRHAYPLASSFALASGDATNLSLTDDNAIGLLFDAGTPVSGNIARTAYRTLTTPANDWFLKVGLRCIVPGDNYSHTGIFMQDSAGGRVQAIGFWQDGTLLVTNLTTTSYSATASTLTARGTGVLFLGIRKVGTAVTYLVSSNGEHWTTLYTTTATAWLAANPNRVGIIVGYNRTAASNNAGNVFYWSLTGTAV